MCIYIYNVGLKCNMKKIENNTGIKKWNVEGNSLHEVTWSFLLSFLRKSGDIFLEQYLRNYSLPLGLCIVNVSLIWIFLTPKANLF